MGEGNPNRFAGPRAILAYVVALLVLGVTSGSAAQIFPTPTPTPRRTPQPTPTPPPSVTPTQDPEPTETDIPLPTDDPNDTPKPKSSGTPPSSSPKDGDKKLDKLPSELEKPTLVVPVFARTRPRNTAKLVDLLEPLARNGTPLEQVLVEGMGRFPVAGIAYYRDDWLNPRYNPTPHLHKGLDIFADFGTPLRSPDRGVVTRLTNDSERGGIGTWIRGSDGTTYYFAHQLERVEGLFVGKRVGVGELIGYVGDTGNAQGGAPHLHFELHRGGPIPPKPSVDRWLDEAIELAPKWVAARQRAVDTKRDLLGGLPSSGAKHSRRELDATMLLTLLDPVGGSVGLLPRLQLEPMQRARVSSGLLHELIRTRLDGYLFVPSSSAQHLRD